MTTSAGVDDRHKVLVVDDDAVSLELMALLLAHEGHQVLRANNAGAALELLSSDRTGRPDVLLVDLQMPGVSGGQLAEKIRALDRSLNSPRPLLLAMSATEVRRQQLLAFDGFLLKPLAVDELRRVLKPRNSGRRPAARITHRRKLGAVAGAPVDTAVVKKMLTMMSPQALHDVFAACIADTRACVETLRNQVQAGDGGGVRQLAHRIKGAASMVGAIHLAGIAARLEKGGSKEAATPGVLDDLLSACSELERMLLAGNLTKTQGPQ